VALQGLMILIQNGYPWCWGCELWMAWQEAIEHIQDHSTGHSDGILTQDEGHADQFTQQIDSAVVYVNASTRFTDGSQLGLGAEVAVSTQKLHARGPMALEALTTYKWVITGIITLGLVT
jgi:glutamate-5-semialdehyde dehydrogenase